MNHIESHNISSNYDKYEQFIADTQLINKTIKCLTLIFSSEIC